MTVLQYSFHIENMSDSITVMRSSELKFN